MKTSEIAAPRAARMAQFPASGLLCEKLRSPAEVSFSTTMPQRAACWRSARLLWEQNHRAESISAMADLARRAGEDAGISIPTLLLMAHMLTDHGDTVGAERCLQSAMKQLGHQTGMPVKLSDPARSRISTVAMTETEISGARFHRAGHVKNVPHFQKTTVISAPVLTASRYALCARDWLILAIQALLNHDLESCLLWIHQADRRVFDSVAASESPQRLRLIGDLHAVLACVAAQAEEIEEAEMLLATAYLRHVQAESFQAACRDLILTARLARLKGHSDRTQTLLDAAECQLVMELTADEADRSPLMDIIHSDRMQIAGASHPIFQQIRQPRKRF